MENNALKINEEDNVVIAIHDIKQGEVVVVDGQELLEAAGDIETGHKIAIAPLSTGEKVYRYGEPIVEATSPVKLGEWVHVHNTQPIPGDLDK